jgi:hypothetical protein
MDPVTIAAIAGALYQLGDFVYHRWFYEPPKGKIEPQEVGIPLAEEGARIPLIYGKCRVRTPILAWNGTPAIDTGDVVNGWASGVKFYRMDMFFVVGIGMDDGAGTSATHGMWIGDNKAFPWTEDKEVEVIAELSASSSGEQGQIGGRAIYYDGNNAQDPAAGQLGTLIGGTEIPAFRKYISIALYNSGGQWIIGGGPSVPAYSFEASSYQDTNGYPAVGTYARIGDDSNPVNVLWDVLKCSFGKLGISTSYIDSTSFSDAATTLYNESHGYSRSVEGTKTAKDFIQEILRQIDGVLYFDDSAGTLKLKLIRADYNTATIPHITRDNAVDLVNFSIGGWSVVNRVRLGYTDRDNDYQDNSVTVQNPANSYGQNVSDEDYVQMPGVHVTSLANRIAARELAWKSRPQIKCRAIVDRSFIRVNPGDAVKVTWSTPDISGLVFRVAAVDRGTLTDGRIALDLLSDVNYVWRGRVPEPPSAIDTGRVGGIVDLG